MSSQVANSFWKTCIVQVIQKSKKGFTPSEEDLLMLGTLYEKAQGSWVGLASGDPDSWELLRRCVRVYLKRKLKKENDGN